MRSAGGLLWFVTLLPGALLASTATDNCAIEPAAIIGHWQHDAGPGWYEQMAFLIEDGEHGFYSWLHERPEYFGLNWTLDNCILSIDYTKYDLDNQQYRVRGASVTELTLESAEGIVTYQRMPN